MTREEAINEIKSWDFLEGKEIEAIHTLIPELRESEDERIRKDIINLIYWLAGNPSLCSRYYRDRYDDMLAWLEKQKETANSFTNDVIEVRSFQRGMEEGRKLETQKEPGIKWLKSDNVKNPDKPYVDKAGMFYTTDGRMCYASEIEQQKENSKSADSISSDCTSDAKYEGRWHNVKDSLPDSTREVLCKDAIGNYFIGRYYSKGVWEVYMYDDCDKSNEDNPPVVKWCEIPSEKQKEQKPVKMEVYEVGKGTTICGQDYKCKKDYKEGNCRYIKDAIYHCGRDGYLTDQNGVSWSCTPEWFNEYIQSNTEWAEEEKTRFVSGQFLQCKLSFEGFKEGEHYWLEYVGDDMYVGRSDNILNQKFHITPRQLFTLFSQQLEEVQGPPQEEKQVPLNYEPPFNENPSDREIIEALIKHLKEQDGILTAIDCISTKAILSWLEKQKELPFVKDVVLGLPGLYFYDGERMHFGGSPAMEENPYNFTMSQQEKQKEQDKCPEYCVRSHCIGCPIYEKQKEQKHPNGCFTCDEYKKGYEEGRRNGFTAGYNKAMKEVEQKEQKPAQSEEEKEYVRTLKGLVSDFIRDSGGGITDIEYYQNICDWLDGRHIEQKPAERSLEDDHIIGFVYDLLNEIEWKDDWAMSKDECLRLLSNYIPQKPAEWDDYTKTNLGRAIQIIKDARGTLHGYQTDDGIYECDKAIEALEHFLYRGLEIEKLAEWSEDIIRKAIKEVGLTQHQIDWFKTNVFPPKPEWSEEDEKIYNSFKVICERLIKSPHGEKFETDAVYAKKMLAWLKSLRLQPKQEWSKEDEKDMAHIIRILDDCCVYGIHDLSKTDHENLVNKLKSIRPQSKGDVYKEKNEAFKLGKQQLAIGFMNYLDDNRPKSKMISNGEYADIDKAFKENNWKKIMGYADKYLPYVPSWKPSEHQMSMLLAVINDPNNAGSESCHLSLKSLYNELKKL